MKDVIEAAHALREQIYRACCYSLGAEGARFGVNASGEWIATVSRCRKHRWRRVLWLVA